jgi:DNA-binding transcriptional LysR family regulator
MDLLSNMAMFVEVVRLRSFHLAAEHLNMPASTLSRRISAFEKQLGIKLLHRTTRKIEPTHEGMQYHARCAPLVEEARLALEDLMGTRDRMEGVLRVSCSSDLANLHLQPMLATFMAAHPKLQMQWDLTVRRVDLHSESVDAALRLGRLEDSSLVARHIADFPAGLFASPAFIQTHGLPNTPQQLTKLPCLRMNAEAAFSQWTLVQDKDSLTTEKVIVDGRVTANSMQMLEFLCRQGHGIALIDLCAANLSVEQGALVRVLPQWQSVATPLHLVTASRMVPARVRVFGDELVNYFKGHPTQHSRLGRKNAPRL